MTKLARQIAFVAAGVSASVGCGAGDDTSVAAPIVDAGVDATKSDAASADAQPPAEAYVRLGDFSPDLASIDLCVAPHGTTEYVGPLLSTAFSAPPDAGGAGLGFGQVSRYVATPARTVDLRIVAANATDCLSPLTPDTTGYALSGGSATLVAAVGTAGALAIQPFADDVSAPLYETTVRFIDAFASVGAVNVGIEPSGTFFAGVGVPQDAGAAVATSSDKGDSGVPINALGYVSFIPVATDAMGLAIDVTDPPAIVGSYSATFGVPEVVTLVLAPSPDAGSPLLFDCDDSADFNGAIRDCAVLP
jgi:hypothetical protein